MHEPVLVGEVIELLLTDRSGTFVDATAGAGGHAEAIMRNLGGGGRLIGFDRDDEAVARTTARMKEWGRRCEIVRGNFADMTALLLARGIMSVSGILYDLGISSDELDTPERGFSFSREGDLDMRMSRDQELTAGILVNTLPEGELADTLWSLGDESKSRRIARAIAAERAKEPIRTTTRLAGIVERAVGGRRGRIHPATKTFMALRMRVNDEMGSLARGLDAGVRLLRNGGRMAIIAFHSKEDAMVKNFGRRHEGRFESLQQGGSRLVAEWPYVSRINRKPIVAGDEEVAGNPRARSAKLRVFERIERAEEGENHSGLEET